MVYVLGPKRLHQQMWNGHHLKSNQDLIGTVRFDTQQWKFTKWI